MGNSGSQLRKVSITANNIVLLTSANSRISSLLTCGTLLVEIQEKSTATTGSLLLNLDDSWMPVKSPQFICKVLA